MDSAPPRELDDYVEQLTGPEGPVERFDVETRRREFEALRALLLEGRTGDDPRTEPLAEAIAAGALGNQHLWKDLRLPGRPVLRAILEAYFYPLASGNTRDMRWKRYFYKRLCGWPGFEG